METKDKYKPIACSYYDLFEIAAMRKQIVLLELKDGNSVRGLIQTLTSKNEEGEFLVLENGTEIRLDFVKSINGEEPTGYC